MNSQVRPELSTASVGSSQAPTAAVDNSAPSPTRPESTYKSGITVQANGTTSFKMLQDFLQISLRLYLMSRYDAPLLSPGDGHGDTSD
jgi:hypothetical protein